MPDVIFTNHLVDRIYERKISKDQLYQTVKNPDSQTRNGDKTEFKKKIGAQTLTAVTAYNDRGDFVVVSAWIDPPNPGTTDERKKGRFRETKKAGLLKKFWLTFLNQLGI